MISIQMSLTINQPASQPNNIEKLLPFKSRDDHNDKNEKKEEEKITTEIATFSKMAWLVMYNLLQSVLTAWAMMMMEVARRSGLLK